MRKIAHLVNPFLVSDPNDDNAFAQPVTFETMKRARDFAAGTVEVSFYSTQYPEDYPIIPAWLVKTPDLTRSVYDLGAFQKKRKLPLLADILDRLYEASPQAEYLIYSNVDIGLMPHFYLAVDNLIESGYDAFVINRRTIKKYRRLDELPKMYAAIGDWHWGHDCFVYRREVYPQYRLGAICIGTRKVGRVLLWNLIVHARKFRELKHNKHLTFHLGNDPLSKRPEYADYDAHNLAEARRILAELERDYGPFPESHPMQQFPIHDIPFGKIARRDL